VESEGFILEYQPRLFKLRSQTLLECAHLPGYNIKSNGKITCLLIQLVKELEIPPEKVKTQILSSYPPAKIIERISENTWIIRNQTTTEL